MVLKLFNTLTKRKETFKPLKAEIVNMYNCGLTVYDYAHIGNFRSFVFADLLRRYLEYKGFTVRQVVNFTDVGHMFEDIDIGEDKLEFAAKREKKDPWTLAEYYINSYLEDSLLMRLEEPMIRPRATDNIDEMLKLIKKILNKGYAYIVNGSVYFYVCRFQNYGKLSGNTIKKLRLGADGRVGFNPDKRDQFDFALWINDPKHIMNWKSPWCEKGYPGWHIECSTMAIKYLGETIDIHTGGVDNLFPHHENEIAQSEAATGHKFVNYWLHIEHLIVEGRKMSKSLGNFYTLKDLLAKGYDPMSIKYLLIATHYKQQLNFTFEGLEAANRAVNRLENFILRLVFADGTGSEEFIDKMMEEVKRNFEEAMDDDLNISVALAAIFDFVRKMNRIIDDELLSKRDAKKIYDFMMKIDKVLGILSEPKKEKEYSKEIKDLIQKRELARKREDWTEADAIRKELEVKGFFIEDTPKGPRIKSFSAD